MIESQRSKICQEIDAHSCDSTCQNMMYKQDIFVLDFATAKKIAFINKLKTPKLNELTDRGVKLVAHFSGLKHHSRKLAEVHTISEVYRSVSNGDCGFDFISKN